ARRVMGLFREGCVLGARPSRSVAVGYGNVVVPSLTGGLSLSRALRLSRTFFKRIPGVRGGAPRRSGGAGGTRPEDGRLPRGFVKRLVKRKEEKGEGMF